MGNTQLDVNYLTFCLEKLGEALYIHGSNLNRIKEASDSVDYLYTVGVLTSNRFQEKIK